VGLANPCQQKLPENQTMDEWLADYDSLKDFN